MAGLLAQSDGGKMDTSNAFKLRPVVSESYVVFEFVKTFCTCGRELSSLFFELTAAELFQKTMEEVLDENEMYDVMSIVFQRDKESVFDGGRTAQKDIGFCCKLALQFGRSLPLSLEDPREGVRKDQPPESLPGALQRRKAIYWSA